MKQVLKAGVLYFAVVFAVGFVLGTVRTLFVVPRVAVRTAELAEAPLMLTASVLAARLVIRRLGLATPSRTRLAVGLVALGLMLLLEFTFVLWLRGVTVREYLQTRDPVSGLVYFASLGAFAVMPLFVGRTANGNVPPEHPF